MSKSKIASKEERTIDAEVMTEVLKYAPKEPFRLTSKMLNKTYRTIGVDKYTLTSGAQSFSVVLEDEDGGVITLSASALKRSRMLTVDAVDSSKTFKKSEGVLLRSNASEIWGGSVYLHKGVGMRKDEEFVIPDKFYLKYAIVSEDREGKPQFNPFLYKYFKTVVDVYIKNDSYPTMEAFKEELLKGEGDGRIKGLPKAMKEPELYDWVKEEVSDYKHTLIFAKK